MDVLSIPFNKFLGLELSSDPTFEWFVLIHKG